MCGDPNCAPVDTVFTLVWESGGKGVFAIPAAPHELEKEDVLEFFPVSGIGNYSSSFVRRC